MTNRRAARFAACSLAVALATGLGAPAMAAPHFSPAHSQPGPSAPPAPAPTAAPADSGSKYCKQDPDWYLCQHSQPPR
jgi:hypothetical protein